jgi:glycosyltransferase involved in cell wall biosynthesis
MKTYSWKLDDKMDDITLVCDPLLSDYGPTRPPLMIATELMKKGYNVKLISTTIANEVRKRFLSDGILIIDLKKKTFSKQESLAWFVLWLEEAVFSLNSKCVKEKSVTLNFSNTVAMPTQVWYAQGPPSITLENMSASLSLRYRVPYTFSASFLQFLDHKVTKRFAKLSRMIVTNSRYLKSVYEKYDVRVNAVIYPPLNCEEFKPDIKRPAGDYVLTYFGKETRPIIVKAIADAGVKIKAFGGKSSTILSGLSKHKNIEMLGRVSNEELVNLYSNALFTLYPFTDEPFGYIPIESMACSTPVLTFNRQGPKESVVHNETGWLENTDREIVNRAVALWKNGYPITMRKSCIQRSQLFDVNTISNQWLDCIRSLERLE